QSQRNNNLPLWQIMAKTTTYQMCTLQSSIFSLMVQLRSLESVIFNSSSLL
ncbi:hypothetical protein A2U01_0048175, partial [Trifolium medium]|nr:hypothetical protein [Trifolium medium]